MSVNTPPTESPETEPVQDENDFVQLTPEEIEAIESSRKQVDSIEGTGSGKLEEYVIGPAVNTVGNLWRFYKQATTPGQMRNGFKWESIPEYHNADKLKITPDGKVKFNDLLRSRVKQEVKRGILARAFEEKSGITNIGDRLQNISDAKFHYKKDDTEAVTVGKTIAQLGDHLFGNLPLGLFNKAAGNYDSLPMPSDTDFVGTKIPIINSIRKRNEAAVVDFSGVEVTVEPSDTDEEINWKVWDKLQDDIEDAYIDATRMGVFDDASVVAAFSKANKLISPLTTAASSALKGEKAVALAAKSTKLGKMTRFVRDHPRTLAAATQAAEGTVLREYPHGELTVETAILPSVFGGTLGFAHGVDLTPRKIEIARDEAAKLFEIKDSAKYLAADPQELPVKDPKVDKALVHKELMNLHVVEAARKAIKEKVSPTFRQDLFDFAIYIPEIDDAINLYAMSEYKGTPESVRNVAMLRRLNADQRKVAASDPDPETKKAKMDRIISIEQKLSSNIGDTESLLKQIQEEYPHLYEPANRYVAQNDIDSTKRLILNDMFKNILNSENDDLKGNIQSRFDVGVLRGIQDLAETVAREETDYFKIQRNIQKLQSGKNGIDTAYSSAMKALKGAFDETDVKGADNSIRNELNAIIGTLQSAFESKSAFNEVDLKKRLTTIKNSRNVTRAFEDKIDIVSNTLEVWSTKQRGIDNQLNTLIRFMAESHIAETDFSVKMRNSVPEQAHKPANVVNSIFSESDAATGVTDHHTSLLLGMTDSPEVAGRIVDVRKLLEDIGDKMQRGLEVDNDLMFRYQLLMDQVTGKTLRAEADAIRTTLREENISPENRAALTEELKTLQVAYKGTIEHNIELINTFEKAVFLYNNERARITNLSNAIDVVLSGSETLPIMQVLGVATQTMHDLTINRFRSLSYEKFRTLAPLWNDITADMPFSPERKAELFKEFTGDFVQKIRDIADDTKKYESLTRSHILNMKAAASVIPAYVLRVLDVEHQRVYGKALDKETFLGYFLTPNNNFNAWAVMSEGFMNLSKLQLSADEKVKALKKGAKYKLWNSDYGEHMLTKITGFTSIEGLRRFADSRRMGETLVNDIIINKLKYGDLMRSLVWDRDEIYMLHKIDGMEGLTDFLDGMDKEKGYFFTPAGKAIYQMLTGDLKVTKAMYSSKSGMLDFANQYADLVKNFNKEHIDKLTTEQRAVYENNLLQDGKSMYSYWQPFFARKQELSPDFFAAGFKNRKWLLEFKREIFNAHEEVIAKQNVEYETKGINIRPKQYRAQRSSNSSQHVYNPDDLSNIYFRGEDFSSLYGSSKEGQLKKANEIREGTPLLHPLEQILNEANKLIVGAYTAHPRVVLDEFRILTESAGYRTLSEYISLFQKGRPSVEDTGSATSNLMSIETRAFTLLADLTGNPTIPLTLRAIGKTFFGLGKWAVRLADPVNQLYNAGQAITFSITQGSHSLFRGVPWYVKTPARMGLGALGFSFGGVPGALGLAYSDVALNVLLTGVRIGGSWVAQGLLRRENPSFGNRHSPVINKTLGMFRDAKRREQIDLIRNIANTSVDISKSGVKSSYTANKLLDMVHDFAIGTIKEPGEMALSHSILRLGSDVYGAAYSLIKKHGDVRGRELAAEIIADSCRSRTPAEIRAQVNNILKAVMEDKPLKFEQDFLEFYHSSNVGNYGPMAAPIFIRNIAATVPGATRFFAAKTMGMYRLAGNLSDVYDVMNRRWVKITKGTSVEKMPIQAQGLVWASTFGLLGFMGASYYLKNGFGQSAIDDLKTEEIDSNTESALRFLVKDDDYRQAVAIGFSKGVGIDPTRLAPLSVDSIKNLAGIFDISYGGRGTSGGMFLPSIGTIFRAIKDYTNAWSGAGLDGSENFLESLNKQVENIDAELRHADRSGDMEKFAALRDKKIAKIQSYEKLKYIMLGDAFTRNSVFTSWITKDFSPFRVAYVINTMRVAVGATEANNMAIERVLGGMEARTYTQSQEERYYPLENLLVFYGWKEYFNPEMQFLYHKFYTELGPWLGMSPEEIEYTAQKAAEIDQLLHNADEYVDALVRSGAWDMKAAKERYDAAVERVRTGYPATNTFTDLDYKGMSEMEPDESFSRLLKIKKQEP